MAFFIKAGLWRKGKLPVKGELDLSILSTPPTPPAYMVYTAKLTQTGTNAPVASVLQNTFPDNVVWSYGGEGYYTATFEHNYFVNESDFAIIAAGAFVRSGTGEVLTVAGFKDNPDAIAIATRGNLTPGYDIDGVLSNHTIEIRVYI